VTTHQEMMDKAEEISNQYVAMQQRIFY